MPSGKHRFDEEMILYKNKNKNKNKNKFAVFSVISKIMTWVSD